MPERFDFCKVCKLNHNQGKGHKYSSKHQQRLAAFLSNAQRKLKDVIFFLKNPSWLRNEYRPCNKFWCSFCEEEVLEMDSMFVCSNTIKHLANTRHLKNVKKFWFENGADVEKRHLYVINGEALAKWEDACKALSASALGEPSLEAVNDIHSACCSSITTSCEVVSVRSFANSHLKTVEPSPLYKDGNYSCTDQDIDRRSLDTPQSQACRTSSVSQGLDIHVQTSNRLAGKMEEYTGLTCIREPSLRIEDGNVHSGAPPPWFQKSDIESVTHGSSQSLLRVQAKRLKKIRNPKRVGAAWAERRRAEIEMETRGEFLNSESRGSKNWLPSFGRVWQSGTRKDTRKEFEAEKRSEQDNGQGSQLEKSNTFQPYISKRQL